MMKIFLDDWVEVFVSFLSREYFMALDVAKTTILLKLSHINPISFLNVALAQISPSSTPTSMCPFYFYLLLPALSSAFVHTHLVRRHLSFH